MEPLAVVMALAMGTHPRLSRGERLRPYVAREPDAARAQPPAAPPPASGQASGESEASPESPPGDPSPPRERAPHLPPAVEVSHVTRAVTGAGSTGEEQAPLEAVDGGEKSDGRQKEAEGTGDAVPSQPTEDADMLAKPDARDAEAVPAMVVVPVVPLSVPEEAKVRAGEAKAETAVQEANTAHLLEGGVEEGAVAGESENIAREEPGEQEEGAHAALPEEMQVAPAAEHAGVAEHEVVAGEMTTTTPQVLADGHGGVDSQDSNGVAEGGEPTGEEDPEEEKEWKKTGMRPEMALFDTLKGDSAALRILVTCIAEALQWRIVRTRPQVGDNGEEEELTEEDVVARIAEARVVFDQFDADAGGTIDASELRAALEASDMEGARGMHLTRRLGSRQVGEEEVKNLIKEFDPKRTGELTFQSFCKMQGIPKLPSEVAAEKVEQAEKAAKAAAVLPGKALAGARGVGRGVVGKLGTPGAGRGTPGAAPGPAGGRGVRSPLAASTPGTPGAKHPSTTAVRPGGVAAAGVAPRTATAAGAGRGVGGKSVGAATPPVRGAIAGTPGAGKPGTPGAGRGTPGAGRGTALPSSSAGVGRGSALPAASGGRPPPANKTAGTTPK
ncbi:hypothetical protein T484DRAFT_1837481 [Baffinella frigidus]|nr:hypothetical protein T484DRAFT_1837481 [Cryptophyta sp. CCMP2293]